MDSEEVQENEAVAEMSVSTLTDNGSIGKTRSVLFYAHAYYFIPSLIIEYSKYKKLITLILTKSSCWSGVNNSIVVNWLLVSQIGRDYVCICMSSTPNLAWHNYVVVVVVLSIIHCLIICIMLPYAHHIHTYLTVCIRYCQ